MARRPTPTGPPPASLTIDDMRNAIPRIEARIRDLEVFDPLQLQRRGDPKVSSIENRLRDTLASIFGRGTAEYTQYIKYFTHFDKAPSSYIDEIPLLRVIEEISRSKVIAIQALRDIKTHFEEEIGFRAPTASGRAIRAFSDLDLHPEVARAASDLYKNGHYANAIEDAVKALNNWVRHRSAVSDRDGTTLMEFVFNPKNPILKFNALADQSDLDEQKGFMMMMSGAVAGLRNPRAHKIIVDDPESALEFIAFISLLAKFVDKAQK
jgi:uncharacterized protein (TIGR02391 family)